MATGGDPAAGGGGILAHVVVWTAEEVKISTEGLERHNMNPTFDACLEIAAALPRKTIIDVGLRCDWLLMVQKESKRRTRDGHCISVINSVKKETITGLSDYHVLRPVADMSSDDNGDVRNLLDFTEDILKKVGENPQLGNDNIELLFRAMKNIVKIMEYYWINDA